jgi:hypothetical protein
MTERNKDNPSQGHHTPVASHSTQTPGWSWGWAIVGGVGGTLIGAAAGAAMTAVGFAPGVVASPALGLIGFFKGGASGRWFMS